VSDVDAPSELGSVADYVLVERFDRANNGDFFLARAPRRLGLDAEFVLLKVFDSGVPADTLRRGTRELRAFASVQSAHLVTLHDAGQDGHRLFYSMEYLPLGSLARPRCEIFRERVVRAVIGASRAAHDLHEHGMAHRDIQPANVMLTEDGGKLADLGLAQVLVPDHTATGFGNLGVVEYIDPGVLQGGDPSRASDIWSLGTTLHRAIAGVGVFGELPADQPLAAIRKVLSADVLLLVDPDDPLRSVIERCLRMATPGFPTAADLADALETVLGP
jgi:serine/threonine protein kinase